MNDRVVNRLAAEVLELFDAGGVGLYEFIWSLRSDEPGWSEIEYLSYAQAALSVLLSHGAVRLTWQRWPPIEDGIDADMSEIDWAKAWGDPTDEPYLEVVSTQDRKSRIALMEQLDSPSR